VAQISGSGGTEHLARAARISGSGGTEHRVSDLAPSDHRSRSHGARATQECESAPVGWGECPPHRTLRRWLPSRCESTAAVCWVTPLHGGNTVATRHLAPARLPCSYMDFGGITTDSKQLWPSFPTGELLWPIYPVLVRHHRNFRKTLRGMWDGSLRFCAPLAWLTTAQNPLLRCRGRCWATRLVPSLSRPRSRLGSLPNIPTSLIPS